MYLYYLIYIVLCAVVWAKMIKIRDNTIDVYVYFMASDKLIKF